MKKLFIIAISFLLCLGYLLFDYYQKWQGETKHKAAIWSYIPTNAALVYQTQATILAINNSSKKDTLSAPAIQATLSWLYKLTLHHEKINDKLTFSVHALANTDIGCIVYVPLSQQIETLWKKSLQAAGYHVKEQFYGQQAFFHITHPHQSTSSFQYFIHEGHLIGTTSSSLLQTVIDHIHNHTIPTWFSSFHSDTEETNMYINFSNLYALLKPHCPPQGAAILHFLQCLAHSSQLTRHASTAYTLWHGVTHADTIGNKGHLLTQHPPKRMTLQNYVPYCTWLLQHYTFDQAAIWYKTIAAYYPTQSKKNTFLPKSVWPLLNGEIAHCALADSDTADLQVVLIKVNNTTQCLRALQAAKYITTEKITSLYPLYTCSKAKKWCISPAVPTFFATHLGVTDSCIVLCNSMQAWKKYAQAYRQQHTWGAHAPHDAWRTNTLDKSTMSLFMHTHYAWPYLLQAIKPTWRAYCKTIKPYTSRIALQWVPDQDSLYYTSMLISKISKKDMLPILPTPQPTTPLGHVLWKAVTPIISKPWLVKGHNIAQKGHYVWAQDSINQLYCVTEQGTIVWKKKLDGPLVSDIMEVDYYHNGKTQYLFATAQQVYLIDRLGKILKGYPFQLPHGQSITHMNILSYADQKKYRIAITSSNQVYMYTQDQKLLPEWGPKKFPDTLVSPLQHYQIAKKDYLIALQSNGYLHIMNRRGTMYPAFTKQPTIHSSGAVSMCIIPHNNPKKALCTILTEHGHLHTINFQGQVVNKLSLHQTTPATRFELCLDGISKKKYVLLQKDTSTFSVLNAMGYKLFSKPYFNKNKQVICQYYALTSADAIYAITQPGDRKLCLYNTQGHPIIGKDGYIPSTHRMACIQDQQHIKLYSTVDNRIISYRFSNGTGIP